MGKMVEEVSRVTSRAKLNWGLFKNLLLTFFFFDVSRFVDLLG